MRAEAALLLLTATATTSPAVAQTADRRDIRMPGRTDDRPYSDAVLVGNTLYLSGRIGLDPKTQKPPADPGDEVKMVLDQIKGVLGEAKMTMDDLVYVQVYCPDLSLYDTFNKIYRSYFTGKSFPARAFIGSGPLLFGGRFEVQAIAVKR
jgi:reactive intermediate/imine deaminase